MPDEGAKLTPVAGGADEAESYPTEAEAREREKRNTQTASGTTNVAKRRVQTVAEPDAVFAEDLSSLVGELTGRYVDRRSWRRS